MFLAEVESSRGGEYNWGHYMLSIADCRHRIDLEFFLGTAQARRVVLAKIDRLINVLTKFRVALWKEAQLIANWEREGKRGRTRRVRAADQKTVKVVALLVLKPPL